MAVCPPIFPSGGPAQLRFWGGVQWVFIVLVENAMDQEAGEVHSRSGSTTEELSHCQLEQTLNQLWTSFFDL